MKDIVRKIKQKIYMGDLIMGYILPVTNYQYIQYAEREAGLEHDPFLISKISRVKKGDPFGKGQEQQEQTVSPMKKRKEQQQVTRMQLAASDISSPGFDRVYKKKVNPLLVSQTYAEITGKGRHYSESI